MKSLVFLVALTLCSAHLGPFHGAPWVLPPVAKPITEDPAGIPLLHSYDHFLRTHFLHPLGHHLFSPNLHSLQNLTVGPSSPFGHLYGPYPQLVGPISGSLSPFGYPLPLHVAKEEEEVNEGPYGHLYGPYPQLVGPISGPLNPFGYPLPLHVAKEEEEQKEDVNSRRRRDVKVPLPYLQVVPTTKNVTVETKQFEAVDAATPADTTKIELTTKQRELTVPAVKYVQPHVNFRPVTYAAYSPAVLPYAGGYSPAVFPHAVSPPVLLHAPVGSPAVPHYAGVFPHHGPFTGYPYPVASASHH